MSKIIDLFGFDVTAENHPDWSAIVSDQICPLVERRCFKVRKSQSHISIGTCTVDYAGPVMICPHRLLEGRKIFTDCFHLLSHEPGNEIHIVPEIGIPGGTIDYFLASVRKGRVRDFVGIELQTLDTTGTVWPERQRFLAERGVAGISPDEISSSRSFGMNWKMTAKTILVQLHHKIRTFEEINKHLVLVVQDRLLNYMHEEFQFSHLSDARLADPMHFHAYEMVPSNAGHKLEMVKRLSTDTDGIARCLGLQSEAKMEQDLVVKLIERKLSAKTLFDFNKTPPPLSAME